MQSQTNCSNRDLVYPVVNSHLDKRSPLDLLQRETECFVESRDGSQRALLPELDDDLFRCASLLCLISLSLVLIHQGLSNPLQVDGLRLIKACFHIPLLDLDSEIVQLYSCVGLQCGQR